MGYSSRRDANNIPTLFGRKLTRALSYNDRAEVWYEIRYGSNAGAIHATRRYKESDLFSLYNDKDSIISLARSDANDADAKSAYRVYTRHRDTPITVTEVVNGTPQQVTYNGIVAYEARFSTAYGGQTAETNAIRTQLTPAHDYLVQSDYKRQPAHPRRARPGPRLHGGGIRRQEGSVVRRRRRDPGRGGHLKRLAQDRQLRLAFKGNDHLLLQADYIWHTFDVIPVSSGKLPLYFGIGGRVLLADDPLIGFRVPIGLDYMFSNAPVDIFLEFVPILDLAPATDFDFGGGFGARYWF